MPELFYIEHEVYDFVRQSEHSTKIKEKVVE